MITEFFNKLYHNENGSNEPLYVNVEKTNTSGLISPEVSIMQHK